MWLFKKLVRNNFLYTTEAYAHNKKRNSSYIKFAQTETYEFGFIQDFIKTTNCTHINLCNCAANYFVAINKF